MNAYMGCCCDAPEPVPCDNSKGECPPVAIVVEGRIRQTINGTFTESINKTIQCFDCGNFADETTDEQWSRTGSRFETISFKALLVRTTGNVYTTQVASSQYPPATSIFAGVAATYDTHNIVNHDGCTIGCSDFERNDRKSEEVKSSDRDDPVVTSFEMQRSASFFDCTKSPNACYDIEENCYEQFDVQIEYDQIVEYAGANIGYFRQDQTDFFGECYDDFPDFANYQVSCGTEVVRSNTVNMTRWGALNPNEVDTCPLNAPRPISYLASNLALQASSNGCPPVPDPCGECQSGSQGGEMQFAYDIGSTQLIFPQVVEGSPAFDCPEGYGTSTYTFPGAGCQSFYVGGAGYVTNTFSHLETASVGCGTSDTSCLFSTQCGSAQQAGSGTQNGNGTWRGEWETTVGAEFEITRHDLLYSLPNASDWPQNV